MNSLLRLVKVLRCFAKSLVLAMESHMSTLFAKAEIAFNEVVKVVASFCALEALEATKASFKLK